MTTPTVTIVAAVASNGVIGNKGSLPWKSKEDLRHFAQLTMGQPVVMGRKTHTSIGRPLPGRMTIIVSRDAAFSCPGCEVRDSVPAAIAAARQRFCREVFVVGGAEIYRQTFPLADALVLSRMEIEVEGDTKFPLYEALDWKLVSSVRCHQHKPFFTIERYLRSRPGHELG